jgi:hypothetical protein
VPDESKRVSQRKTEKPKMSDHYNKRDTVERVSYEEYLERAIHGTQEVARERYTRMSGDERLAFTKTRSWEDAATLALEGWKEGREMVGKITKDVEGHMDVLKPVNVWDVTGDFVDVGAFVTGEPECMIRWEEEPARKRVARIMLNMSVSAGVSTETLSWRGATVLALIDKLEGEGVRCEVDLGWCCKSHGKTAPNYTVIINVKKAEEPLHMDRMAFHLVHPSSVRRLMFSYAECASDADVIEHGFHDDSGYGMPVSNIQPYLPPGEKYDLVVSGLQLHGVEASIKQIERMFKIICPDKTNYAFDEVNDSE